MKSHIFIHAWNRLPLEDGQISHLLAHYLSRLITLHVTGYLIKAPQGENNFQSVRENYDIVDNFILVAIVK